MINIRYVKGIILVVVIWGPGVVRYHPIMVGWNSPVNTFSVGMVPSPIFYPIRRDTGVDRVCLSCSTVLSTHFHCYRGRDIKLTIQSQMSQTSFPPDSGSAASLQRNPLIPYDINYVNFVGHSALPLPLPRSIWLDARR
jgi:hypothetical protein